MQRLFVGAYRSAELDAMGAEKLDRKSAVVRDVGIWTRNRVDTTSESAGDLQVLVDDAGDG